MQTLKRIKIGLSALALVLAGSLRLMADASRNICTNVLLPAPITITIPDSISCNSGGSNFVGTVETNLTLGGCRACQYQLIFRPEATFELDPQGPNNILNNAPEYAYITDSDHSPNKIIWFNQFNESDIPCEYVDFGATLWWTSPFSPFTSGGATVTLGYVVRYPTNHLGLFARINDIYSTSNIDNAGELLFYDGQGNLVTNIAPNSTAYAVPTSTNAFPPIVTRFQINGSTDEETLGCTIDPTNGIITAGTNSGMITVRAYVTDDSYWVENDLQIGCPSCGSGNCTDDGPGPGLDSLLVTINTGKTLFGKTGSGYFQINQPYPSTALSTPAVLKYYTGSLATNDVLVIRSNGIVQQIFAPQISANVVSNSPYQFQILFYTNSSLSGTPYTTWTFLNPDGSTSSNRLTVTKVNGGLTNEYDYAWSAALNTWSLTTENGTKVETLYDITNGVFRTETHLIYDGSSSLKFQETNVYQTFPWREELIQQTIGSGANALTTAWTFNTNSVDTNNYSHLYQVVSPGNHWERYYYQFPGELVRKITQYLDAPIPANTTQENTNRVTAYGYYIDTDGFPTEGVTNSLNGQQTSWTTHHTAGSVTTDTQVQTPDSSYSSAYHLQTTTWSSITPPFVGEPSQILRPDGTMSFYSYTLSADGTLQTNTVATGQPDPTQSYIIDGTSNVTVLNQAGTQLSRQTFDVASGLLTSSMTNLAMDAEGRPTQVQYLDGTTETTVYGCCGIESFTDRQGTTTAYNYDPYTKNLTAATSLGITMQTGYDAAGNVIQTTRIGTNNSSIVLNVATYDTAGRLTSSTPGDNGSGLNQTTTYSEGFDGSNHKIETTTYPDGGTRVETYYQDGSLLSISGNAVSPLQYSYGMSTTALQYGETTTEVKLGSSGQTNEWTTKYRDALGRNFITVFASASGTPSNRMSYNTVGQLTNMTDPDGAATLYQYDGKGQLLYTATHLGTSSAIDFTGVDRITETVNDVTNDNGVTVNRTRTFVWNINGSNTSNLVATAETSADGLQSWNISFHNGIGQTNHSQTVNNPSTGIRVVTSTAPDGSTATTTNQFGRLISVTQKDASGDQMGQAVYGYDAHGRQNTVIDARNGTTTSVFNDADQIAAVLSPSPDGVQSGQVTSNLFDGVGRICRAVLPDNTAVTNLYYTNGMLQETYGSRTYPVAYTYDAQGRMKTMTTWTNFASATGAAVTTWNYDGYRGFLTNKVYADGNGPGYSYTSAGRLQSRVWVRTFGVHKPANLEADYAYDNAGDFSSITYVDSSPTVSYGYDRLGRQTTVTNGTTICNLTYDDLGDLLSEGYSGGPLSGLTVTNLYDSLARRTTNGLWNGSGWLTQTRYGYDAASRLQTVSDGTNSANYSYITNSPLTSQIVFTNNGTLRMTTSKSYDFLNRLTAIQSSVGGSMVASFSYANNSANQRSNATNDDNSYWVYQYDNLGQVVSGKKYWSDGTAVAGQQFNYNFDDIGNRWSATRDARQANYTNNVLNQISGRDVPGYLNILGSAVSNSTVTLWGTNYLYVPTTRKGEYFRAEVPITNGTGAVWLTLTNMAVLQRGTNTDLIATNLGNVFLQKTPETFAYDADGNLTNDGRFAYAWDDENRLTNITSQSSLPTAAKMKLDFAYDYMGRRIQKIVSTNNGSSYVAQYTNKYVYDGWNLIAELGPNNALVRSYMWGNDLSGTMRRAGGVGGLLVANYYGNSMTNCLVAIDGNGDVAALVNAVDGMVLATYEYGPFGELFRANGSMARANPIRFSTKYQDETDLLYYGYRYYGASVGRWLSREPLGENASRNSYAFVGNQPVNDFDILGLVGGYGNPTYDSNGNPIGPSTPFAYNPWGPQLPTPPLSPLTQLMLFKVSAALRCVGGTFEAVGGMTLATGGGIGTVGTAGLGAEVTVPAMLAGATFTVNGVDNMSTGFHNLIFSVPVKTATETVISAGLQRAGISKAYADSIASGINGGLMMAGGFAGAASSGSKLLSCCDNPQLVITVETQTANVTKFAVGLNEADITINGTVATVDIGYIENLTGDLRSFITQLRDYLESQGVDTVVVNTGHIVNDDLLIKLGLAAENGDTIFGGNVQIITLPGQRPQFQIIISLKTND